MEYWTPASALVVVAHPDDIEFGCAGTVARWVSEGAHVTYALLTNGAAGSSDPEMTRERLAELREAEQRASAKVVGVDQVEFLGYEDGLLEPTLEVRKEVVRLIRRVRPEVVVTTDPTTHYFADRYINHPDHRAAGEVTLAAVIPGSDTRLAYPELLAEGLEPVKLTGVLLIMSPEPNLVVDVGDFLDKKMESLRCHVTQIGQEPEAEDMGYLRGMAELSAAKEPFRYGEAFRVFRFDLPWRPPETDPEASLAEA
ncbi:MAG TPA: PIG-L deacetylase family protein [Actinomycetes bacterium]|jgi:LmbE family N-acetylglucosaminyl deacetylase|nr:PIG-L deacetylase family protein [Actinomycetes bacterium]